MAIDFGCTFRSFYIAFASDNGANKSLGIDYHFPEDLPAGIDFHQADFSHDAIVPWLQEYRLKRPGHCIGIMYDILLHQYAPLGVIMNLLSVLDAVCIGNPVLIGEQDVCRFLPCNSEPHLYFPSSWMTQDNNAEPGQFANPASYGWGSWLWGLTPTVMQTWIRRQGFEIVAQQSVMDKPDSEWMWWGCCANRV